MTAAAADTDSRTREFFTFPPIVSSVIFMSQRDSPTPAEPDASNAHQEPSRTLQDFWAAVERGKNDEQPPSIVDASADESSITVIYTSPHFSHGSLGYRRTFPPHFMNNDPATNGRGAYEEISEPLGTTANDLHEDADGVFWWGDEPGRS
jgi:hypothetical protein